MFCSQTNQITVFGNKCTLLWATRFLWSYFSASSDVVHTQPKKLDLPHWRPEICTKVAKILLQLPVQTVKFSLILSSRENRWIQNLSFLLFLFRNIRTSSSLLEVDCVFFTVHFLRTNYSLNATHSICMYFTRQVCIRKIQFHVMFSQCGL